MSGFVAKTGQTVEKTHRARKLLCTSRADVQEMTNDELNELTEEAMSTLSRIWKHPEKK